MYFRRLWQVVCIFALRLIESAVGVAHLIMVKFALGIRILARVKTCSSSILTLRSLKVVNLKLILISIYWCLSYILSLRMWVGYKMYGINNDIEKFSFSPQPCTGWPVKTEKNLLLTLILDAPSSFLRSR